LQVFNWGVIRKDTQFDVYMGGGGFGANNGCAGSKLAMYDYSKDSYFYNAGGTGAGMVPYANYTTNCNLLGQVG